MEDDVDALHERSYGCFIRDVALNQVRAPRHVLRVACGQVVEHADAVTVVDELLSEVGADEAGTTGDQDLHDEARG